MFKQIKILSTLGPSTINPTMIKKLDELGVDIFRINLSHTKSEDIEKVLSLIAKETSKSICIDLEGAQIRSGLMSNNNVFFEEGSMVTIHKNEIMGDTGNLSLTPGHVIDEIQPGDLISIDFDTLLLQVYEKNGSTLLSKVVCGGLVGSNKAVTVDRHIELPPFSPKDIEGINIGLKYKVPYVALSFANKKSDVEALRVMVGDKMHIMSKIESRSGLRNLEDILSVSESILLDRGDMSREVRSELIPTLQKKVIQKANQYNVPIYVATNFLESMVSKKLPTRAEINDITNTLLDGASGIVLAAETAIGEYPIECVNIIKKSIKTFSTAGDLTLCQIADSTGTSDHFSMQNAWGTPGKMDIDNLTVKKLRTLIVDETVLVDAEQIAIGGYAPIQGFMTKDELESVLSDYCLPSGDVWTMPIILQTKKEAIKDFRVFDKIALVNKKDDNIYSVLEIEEIYPFDFADLAKKLFSTTDLNHPGVKMLKEKGNFLLAGKINLVKRLETPFKQFTLTPTQIKHIFEKKGWSKIVGFHSRNAVHRGHEYMQRSVLNKHNIDGLLIHPIVGQKKKLDYHADVILDSYSIMLDKHYSKDKVFVSAFLSFSRYGGPREAVFTALCRKNYGCTHFIVGRDHTGVGDYYHPKASQDLFNKLGEIGIKPIFFNEVYYCKNCEEHVEVCNHGRQHSLSISATDCRNMLQEGKKPPTWFMREDISEMIIEKINAQKPVFVS